MSHSSLSVARYMLDRADQDGRALTPMKIIKLVYMAHGWMLGLYRRPLINDDAEAWRYGPVIPDLYRAIKQFGGDPIPPNSIIPQKMKLILIHAKHRLWIKQWIFMVTIPQFDSQA